MKSLVRNLASKIGLRIMRTTRSEQLEKLELQAPILLDQLLRLNGCSRQSKAQLRQDIFVLMETSFKREGYFVEFGAADGVHLSNTWLLEKEYNWTGILAEPARVWHDDLRANRSAKIDTDCVFASTGGQIEFNMTALPELSTIAQFSSTDGHANSRKNGDIYTVPTISLDDLLKRHGAPYNIDYLSIDTEGSELSIIEHFPFDNWEIRIITVEHNYTAARDRIAEIMHLNGYKRKFEGLSKWDDWYVLDR
jgi:FkbM family methyltransferase